MKVGSGNSVYSLFVPKARKGPSVKDEAMEVSPQQPPKAPPLRTDDELVAEFQARMARQAMEWADTNKDGTLTKSEYLDGQTRLAALNDRPYDASYNEDRWAKLDTTGKGSVNEDELREGLANIFPVKVGHLDPNYRLPKS